MTGRIEGPRRHGHFDRRWSTSRPVTSDWRVTAGVGTSAVPGELEWDTFSTRYFPGRLRHDLEAISAYDSYRHGPAVAQEQPPGGKAVDQAQRARPHSSARRSQRGRTSLSRPGATR